jgi:AraC-like DNA-binding protein
MKTGSSTSSPRQGTANLHRPTLTSKLKYTALLQSRDILGVVAKMLRATATFAGTTLVVQLLVLAFFSRHLARPVSVAVRGESSVGKSYAIERAMEFVSPEAIHVLTSMSQLALAYSDEEFVHRVIVLYEADALADKRSAALVRSLLSGGRLVHEYTDFDGGRHSVKIEKEGPTNLVTSAAGRIDYELATRLLSVNVDDGPEATRAILEGLARAAEGKASEPNLSEFHALDRLLTSGERRVVVPFAETLAAACDASATRMRRDFQAVLGLVQAHALLHQNRRERDRDGRIVARVDDYAAVYELVADVLAYSSGQAIPAQIRKTVEAIDQLQHHVGVAGEPVKLAEIAAHLGLHRTTISRRINGAIKLDLLQEVESQRGGPV